jgi:hypothetical protein
MVEGAVCPWSPRDDHFMHTVMSHDLNKRHYEVHAVRRDQDLDIVVVEFDYTVVPFKMNVGSLTSCPLDDNGSEEIRAKWDRVLDLARSTNCNLIKRWLVPTGETSKLMMESGNLECHCDDHDEYEGEGDIPHIDRWVTNDFLVAIEGLKERGSNSPSGDRASPDVPQIYLDGIRT